MSMEQFEAEMTLAGYNEEQIAEEIEKLNIAALAVVQALEEVIQQIAEQLAGTFEQAKETFAELSKLFEEVLDEESPSTKWMEPSKRLAYVNVNQVTSRVVKNYNMRDTRSMNMNFTRYRQKH